MTTTEAIKLIGQSGTMRTVDGLTVECKVLDARTVYGRDQVLITPTSGSGQTWIVLSNFASYGENE